MHPDKCENAEGDGPPGGGKRPQHPHSGKVNDLNQITPMSWSQSLQQETKAISLGFTKFSLCRGLDTIQGLMKAPET